MKNHRIATSKLKLMNLSIYPNFWLLLFQFGNDCSLRLQVLGSLWLGEHNFSSFCMTGCIHLEVKPWRCLKDNRWWATMLILILSWRILVFLPADFVFIGLSIEEPHRCTPLSINIIFFGCSYHNFGVVSTLARAKRNVIVSMRLRLNAYSG